MGTVVRLGAWRCGYYRSGRCRRPTSATQIAGLRCVLLEQRRVLGRRALARLERLDNACAKTDTRFVELARQRIMDENLRRMRRVSCPDHRPAPEAHRLCAHQDYIYCLLKMPTCDSVCEHFFAGGMALEKARQEGPQGEEGE